MKTLKRKYDTHTETLSALSANALVEVVIKKLLTSFVFKVLTEERIKYLMFGVTENSPGKERY